MGHDCIERVIDAAQRFRNETNKFLCSSSLLPLLLLPLPRISASPFVGDTKRRTRNLPAKRQCGTIHEIRTRGRDESKARLTQFTRGAALSTERRDLGEKREYVII